MPRYNGTEFFLCLCTSISIGSFDRTHFILDRTLFIFFLAALKPYTLVKVGAPGRDPRSGILAVNDLLAMWAAIFHISHSR
jgi:hypothetical protein